MLTIDAGISGVDLMAHAGLAVARVVQNEYKKKPVAALVGPGNNGGDAIVAAIELQQAGCQVRLGDYGSSGCHGTVMLDTLLINGTMLLVFRSVNLQSRIK